MRKSAILCAIILCAALLAGCTPCPKTAPVDKVAEAQAIRDQSARWLTLAQERDAETIAGMFLPDAETIFDGRDLKGVEAIKANMEKEHAEAPDATINWTTDNVQVSDSGDLAYERGSWVFDKDGAGEEPEETGEYVTIWKKVGGEWKVAIDTGTTIKPEGEEEEATE